MIYYLKVKFLLSRGSTDGEIQRNHCRRSAQFSRYCGDVIAGDGANVAGQIYNFRGGQRRRKRGHHARAGHGQLHIAEAQEGVAAEENIVAAHRCDRARRVDRGIALHQHHSCHVSRHQMCVIAARRGGAALRGHKSEALNLRGKWLQGTCGETRKYQRGFNRLQR